MNSDRISMTVEMAQLVQERVMYMPHSSNPLNDHTVMSAYVPLLEHAAPPVYSRAALGLPEDAVILANFNNPYKVDAVGVRAWAAALRGAGTGVIWMPEWEGLQSNAGLMRQLLLQEGVGWNAVVTTPLMPRDNHLLGRQLSDVRQPPPPLPFVWHRTFYFAFRSRYRRRDISHLTPWPPQAALDTTAFNGHGTAAESLWAALPLVTLPGDSIGNRVGAAVSIAAGQAALIARNLDEYVLLIQRLLRRPRLSRALGQQLRDKRDAAPLWDIRRCVWQWWHRHDGHLVSGTPATGSGLCAWRGRRRCIMLLLRRDDGSCAKNKA
jgi:protein O-GlcNAc transferase